MLLNKQASKQANKQTRLEYIVMPLPFIRIMPVYLMRGIWQ